MDVVEPTRDQVLEFCARDPVERVFLEDMVRRSLGRFVAIERAAGSLDALCHAGANLVPSGDGCGAFTEVAAGANARMIIGEERAVGDLWEAARTRLPPAREDRPGQPVYTLADPPPPGETGLRPATRDDLERLLPACAAAHELELGIDPLVYGEEAFRWRTATHIADGRSWLWLEDDVVLFKAEVSAWTPKVAQVAQVWSDPEARGHGYAARALRDLCRLLLASTPTVTLFVRTDNAPAIALYERIGMRKALAYRSVLF
jgi:ribosomal protein S18 acetylase RimI-like enzyme